MMSAVRLIRALLLIALLGAAGRAFSAASAHAPQSGLTSHPPKLPAWIDEAERQNQANNSSDALRPPIPAIPLGSPNHATGVVRPVANAAWQITVAVLHQRPPPPRSSI